MSLLGLFATPVGAMLAQSKKIQTIGTNIANVNTGGYKRLETNFATLTGRSYDNNNDIGGVRGISRSLVTQQGAIQSSNSNFDLAIAGQGFFVLNNTVDGSGETFYGRDGAFQQGLGEDVTFNINGGSVTTRAGYLADKNGYFVQGWPVNADFETFNQGTLESIRIDPEAYTVQGESTTAASLSLNLPSDAGTNTTESTFIKAYDGNGNLETYQLQFTNYTLGSASANAAPQWNLPSAVANGYSETNTLTVYDSNGFDDNVNLTWTKTGADTWEISADQGGTAIDIDGTNDGTANPVTVTFDPVTGAITAPVPNISITTPGSANTTFALNLAGMTQNNVGASITNSNVTTIDGTAAQGLDNEWTLEVFDSSGNQIALDADADPNRLTINFNEDGSLASPLSVNIASAAATFALDISEFTQFASGQIVEGDFDFNGRSNARLRDFYFNADGVMIGRFSDATQRPLYKLPLATFTNANALEATNGNVYRYDPNAGEEVLREAGGQGAGSFLPNSREISNVVVEDEFTAMIITQNAYNTASTVVQTIDEMTEVARDLKA